MVKRVSSSIYIVLLIFVASPVASIGQGLSPEDVVRLQAVTGVTISPGGDRVAYTVTSPRTEADPIGGSFVELWTVSFDGGEPTPIVQRPNSASSPAWSPDGTRLAFVARFADHHALPQVYAVPAGGGDLTRLTEASSGVMAFSFSPDGSQMAYTAREPETDEQRGLRERGFDMIVAGESQHHIRLWIDNIDGGSARAITPEDMSVREFEWSPDGTTIALQMTEGVGVDDDFMFRQIYTVASSGGEPRQVTETEGKLGPIRWSPDGRRLAYLGAIAMSDPLPHSIFVVDAAGGEPVNITPDFEATAEWLKWIDDSSIVFTAVEGTRTVLNRISAGGGEIERVAGGELEIFRTAALDVGTGHIAAPVNTRSHPSEVFVTSLMDGNWRRITRHNDFLGDIPLGEQETIEWTSVDGLRMEGVLIRPVGYEPGVRYPLAILPHGGPEGISYDGWTTNSLYPAQALAANGYVVFEPNYRGSGGRGPAFSMANHRDLGGKEFEDVLTGIDHLADIGLIDSDRVGISGTSYGGYFSAWGGTFHTERFAAAITFAGLSNWISFTGTTEIPYEMSLVHWDLWWWDHPGLNMDRSPVSHVPRAQTPILVAHGLADDRVHPEQSLQLYQFLRLNEVPSALVLYPREPHGLRERAHQLDFMQRVVNWFNQYLQAEEEEEGIGVREAVPGAG